MRTPRYPRRLLSIAAFLSFAAASLGSIPVYAREAPVEEPAPRLQSVRSTNLIFSDSTDGRALERGADEIIWIYGAPGSNEGTFEAPGGIPDPQSWIGVDVTEAPSHWQVDTFNAANLGDHGVGNHAAWCGSRADQVTNWADAPGYGNNWSDALVWTSPPLVDPSVAQTIELEFFFNHDTEPGYDYFTVHFDSAGTALGGGVFDPWVIRNTAVASEDGTNRDWQAGNIYVAPGERFSAVQTRDIAYAGNDYSGPDGDRIVLVFAFRSDGAFSDEGGLFPSDGAVQMDDVVIRWDDGTGVIQEFTEDFEGTDPLSSNGWSTINKAFVGDFSSIHPGLRDLDPCWEDASPAVHFMDYGQTVGNAASLSPTLNRPPSTGGSTSPVWDYGLSQSFVVNYTGGLSRPIGSAQDGRQALWNEFRSPPVDVDLPGSADDGADVVGLLLEFDWMLHTPIEDAIFAYWRVRARDSGGEWTRWRDENFVQFSEAPKWFHASLRFESLFDDVTVQAVQVALGVRDLSRFYSFPGADATPTMYFDNVRVGKVRLGGPVIRARATELALSGFAPNGQVDASTLSTRDALDVPFDRAETDDVAGSSVSGDSVLVEILPLIDSTIVFDAALVWTLDRNPLFDTVRAVPSRTVDRNVDTTSDPLRWSGEVIGQQAVGEGGAVVENHYVFDLPDADFLYPGDVLRYHVQAIDSDGRVSTLPRDTSGQATGTNFPEDFTVRALPTIGDASGTQPEVLIVDYGAGASARQQLHLMLDQLGWEAGVDYDLYRRARAEARVGDGLGSTGGHGASLAQLAGYRTILFDHSSAHIGFSDANYSNSSDGSGDASLVESWLALPGPRSVLHVGVDASGGLNGSPALSSYLQTVTGASIPEPLATPIYEHLRVQGGALAPASGFDVFGGCRVESLSELVQPPQNGQQIFTSVPLGGALLPRAELVPVGDGVVGHWFADARTGQLLTPASVLVDQVDGSGDRKVGFVSTLRLGEGLTTSDDPSFLLPTSEWMREVLVFAVDGIQFGAATEAPSARRPFLTVAPTPFNPSTTISLVIPRSGATRVTAYDVRGRKVRSLLDEELEAGDIHRVQWNGRDDEGRPVTSGVYFLKVDAPDWSARTKVVLLK